MCGIAGYVGPRLIEDARADTCATLMHRRGPDARGRSRHVTPDGRNVLLLHSRLAILDLDPRSNQPYPVESGELVFNGEVYNYRELAAALERDGQRLRSTGDTEVLALLLAAEGPAALERCEGMWALSWYSERDGSLLLARDRFGEKPLLVHRAIDGGVYFASEATFLEALLGRPLRPNLRHVRRFLVNGYKSLFKTRETFFEGVEELPAGHVGRVTGEGLWTEFPWWTPRFGPESDMSFEDAVAGTRERLIRSVELRLRSDVPVAFNLSGGVDSNALIAIAKRELGHDVHGYTIMNSDVRYEEADMIRLAVRELGINHREVVLSTNDFLPMLREQTRYHSAPVLTMSSYAGWRLNETIVRDGYRVTINGVGADELFSGYYDHHNAYLADMHRLDPMRHAEALLEWRDGAGRFVRNPFLQDPAYFIARPMSRDHIYLDAASFSGMLRFPFEEAFTELLASESLLRNRMANELRAEAVPVLLREEDLNAMYHSLENRAPFLDSQLFEWSAQIPVRHLVKGGLAKAVLREAVRGMAPDEVIRNPRKVGFNTSIEMFLERGSPSTRSLLFDDSPIFSVVDRERLLNLVDEEFLPNSRSKFLFNFVSAKMFLEECQP
jgi:asparagine synthase (glutamine-hydrolysing)